MSKIIKCIMMFTVIMSIVSTENYLNNSVSKNYERSEFDKGSYNSDSNLNYDINNSRWITNLPSELKPSQISMPGTHDSMAYQMDTSGLGGLQITKDKTLTQSLDITKQLKLGIRYFDIRAKIKDGKFGMYHGSIWLNSYFDDYLDSVQEFLEENPGEFVLMRFKSEGDDSLDSFESTLKSVYLDNPKYQNLFYLNKVTESTKVGDLRGKIVFIQNFNSLNVNVGGYVYPYQHIQDQYEIGDSLNDLHKKSELVISHFESIDHTGDKLSLNHLSGSSSGIFSSIYPWYVASGFTGKNSNIFKDAGTSDPTIYPLWPIEGGNVKVAGTNVVSLDYLNSTHLKNLGIVIMDYPGPNLVNRIIKNNIMEDEMNGSLNIKYLSEGSVNTPNDATNYLKHSYGEISESIPIRVGYRFKGWSYQGNDYAYLKNQKVFNPGEKIYMFDDALLVAQWELDTNGYTVIYTSNLEANDIPIDSTSYKYNEEISISNLLPKYNGYKFKHWVLNNEIVYPGDTIRIERNMELNAVWERREPYTIDLEDSAKASLGLWIYLGE